MTANGHSSSSILVNSLADGAKSVAGGSKKLIGTRKPLASFWRVSSFTSSPRSIFANVFRSTPVASAASTCVIVFLFNRPESAPGWGRTLIFANDANLQFLSQTMTQDLGKNQRNYVRDSAELCGEFSAWVGNFQGRLRKTGTTAAPDELAWAPAQCSAGRTKLMWQRPLVRIAALHARHHWTCWFAS